MVNDMDPPYLLRKGGNAVDAAVAVQFALAVAYPSAGNIGGGGFLVYRKSNGAIGCLDFREKAPLTAHRDMYLDENGEVGRGRRIARPRPLSFSTSSL